MGDKILVTNRAALRTKYGPAGWSAIDAALQRMIVADQARGLVARVVDISDAAAMTAVGGTAVPAAGSPKQCKEAVDAIDVHDAPDYLLLLGGPDVFPYVQLKNPVFTPGSDDPDPNVPSDLPYACDAPYATEADKFLAPSRVVGRLPDLFGAAEPSEFVQRIDAAAQWTSRPKATYLPFLGISADVWKASTTLSLANTFGPGSAPLAAPPSGPGWTAPQWAALSHFINCHGAQADPKFYGQVGKKYPVSHEARLAYASAPAGAVVSAECCYGAELYAPALAAPHPMGIADAYLHRGAYAFFGSTTISYGPPSGNGAADLICQFFLQQILQGASTGRAALEARLAFVQSASATDPIDLKTLAQFVLLSDPSVQPVQPVEPAPPPAPHGMLGMAMPLAKAFFLEAPEARLERRRRLKVRAFAVLQSQACAGRALVSAGTKSVQETLRKLAGEMGLETPRMASFEVEMPAAARQFLSTAKSMDDSGASGKSVFHVMTQTSKGATEKTPRVCVVVAHEEDGHILSAKYLESR